MNWKIIKNESEYKKAIKRTLKIFHAEEDTAEADESALLLLLIKDYEEKYIVLPDVSPLDIIKQNGRTVYESKGPGTYHWK